MKFAIFASAAMAVCTPSALFAKCQQQPLYYDYPAQRVDQGLARFAHRSGCFVEFDIARYGPRRAAPLKGKFTASDALARMVGPVGLVVNSSRDGGSYRLTSTIPTKANPGAPGQVDREARVHQLADALDKRIDAAVTAGHLSNAKATLLHQRVGRVQTEAGHAGRTQKMLSSAQANAFEKTLGHIETALPPG